MPCQFSFFPIPVHTWEIIDDCAVHVGWKRVAKSDAFGVMQHATHTFQSNKKKESKIQCIETDPQYPHVPNTQILGDPY